MSEIVFVVEGQTEQAFVDRILKPHFGGHGVAIWAVLGGKAGKKGGIRRWDVAAADIGRHIKTDRFCTTMFDYYGMPTDWPGRQLASSLPLAQRADHVEKQLIDALRQLLGDDRRVERFIPYVQMHEFEAILFSQTGELANLANTIVSGPPVCYRNRFDQIVSEANNNPEEIDDGYDTCPSRRISNMIQGYKKLAHGVIVAERIGLPRIREACSHFNDWISRLEQVAGATS